MSPLSNDDDPLLVFAAWQREAQHAADPLSDCFVLASADAAGRPSARTLSYRPGPAGEFRFFTNSLSKKGLELAANPHVAAVFHWHVLGRQVRLEGTVHPTDAAASDAYFAQRPLGSRVTVVLSAQSAPMESYSALQERHSRVLAELQQNGEAPARPPHWGGYELTVASIELLQSRPHRLSERHRFERCGARWSHVVLSP
jgi:pyridoxamine 5'-phosphate oxidase